MKKNSSFSAIIEEKKNQNSNKIEEILNILKTFFLNLALLDKKKLAYRPWQSLVFKLN